MVNNTNIDSIIKKFILIDETLYIKLAEKMNEGKIKIDANGNYTAYINGDGEIYIGKNFMGRREGEKVFIILHELLHEILEHIPRFESIKIRRGGKIVDARTLFNIACDMSVNSLLCKAIKENAKMRAMVEIPNDVALPRYFNLPDGRSAEFYLTQLLKNLDEVLNNQLEILKNLDKILNNQSLTNFDEHRNINESNNENENGNGNINKDENEIEIIDMDNENTDIIEEISEKIFKNNISNSSNKNWDENSELIKRVIDKIIGWNTISWKKILRNKIINFINYSNKYERVINKKNLSRDIYYTIISEKYRRKEEFKVNLNLFIDTSGCISEKMLREFVYQMYRIIEDVESISTMNIYLFTDRIYYRREALNLRNKVKAKDIIKKEIENIKNLKGSGTSFREIKEIYDKNKDKKGIYIVFTDGLAEEININKNPSKLFVWIIANNKSFTDRNGNTVIYIEV